MGPARRRTGEIVERFSVSGERSKRTTEYLEARTNLGGNGERRLNFILLGQRISSPLCLSVCLSLSLSPPLSLFLSVLLFF